MLLGLLEFVVLSFLFSLAHCQSNLSAQAIRPAFVPLAVGSPYFSAWLSFGPTSQTTNTWPTFWDADGVRGPLLHSMMVLTISPEPYSRVGWPHKDRQHDL